MTVAAEAVRFGDARMWVGLSDGRVIGVPLAWFPRLGRATPAEREGLEISPFGRARSRGAGIARGSEVRRREGMVGR